MKSFILHHRHAPDECEPAFAAWRGFTSRLRQNPAPATCLTGDHSVWWRVQAADAIEALALLPAFVAARTTAIEVRDVVIP